jgi:hypothetical protein
MKTAIDSYCYHRFFGEVYPQQSTPPSRMTLEDFLRRAHELDVGGVSLESCFIPRLDPEYMAQIRDLLDEYHLDRVFAWGHPDGLEGGTNEHAYAEMIRCFVSAQNIGAKVMRVVGSSLRFRNQPHGPQIKRLTRMFREAVKVAEEYGVQMAVENHIVARAESVREETKIPDSHESLRQHVQEEAAQELRSQQRHRTLLAAVSIVLPSEGDAFAIECEDTGPFFCSIGYSSSPVRTSGPPPARGRGLPISCLMGEGLVCSASGQPCSSFWFSLSRSPATYKSITCAIRLAASLSACKVATYVF